MPPFATPVLHVLVVPRTLEPALESAAPAAAVAAVVLGAAVSLVVASVRRKDAD